VCVCVCVCIQYHPPTVHFMLWCSLPFSTWRP
jgi:hypothetical protein